MITIRSRFIVLFALQTLFMVFPIMAQWAKGIGEIGVDDGIAITVDGSGNSYVIGNFQNTLDFDPGGGTSTLTSTGSNDIFFAKYNSSGGLVWAHNVGSSTSDAGNAIAIDASGNIYITGMITGTANFDVEGGSYDLTSAGSSDIFVAKYNSSVSLQWAFVIGQTTQDIGYGIAADGSGNVFVTGYFRGTADFNPGSGTNNLTSNGAEDIFIAKYNSSGQLSWVKQIGSTGNDLAFGIALDANAKVYITGKFKNTVDFDPNGGTQNLISGGGDDAFFAKYDSSGNYQFAGNIGGTTDDVGNSIAVDASNEVYVTGSFTGTADSDPSGNDASLTSVGLRDIFYAKFDASGNWAWAYGIGGTSEDIGERIKVDGSSNVFLAGSFSDVADFNPAGITNLTSAGGTDGFFAEFSTDDGFLQWAKNIGGGSNDVINGIASGGSFVYCIGTFQSTADFDPSASTSNLISAGSNDFFFAKYQESNGLLPVEIISFTGVAKGKVVELAWQTATEVNNYGFEIERRSVMNRSLEGNGSLAWTKIGFVAGNGNSNSPKSYSFVDVNTSGKVLYHLKQIDNDGKFEYSSEMEVIMAQIPQMYTLMQNYPNPFNPTTTIRFMLPVSGIMSLKVYDMLGREVATLVNGMQEAGEQIVQFNASKLSSGIYFYTLTAGSFTATKKLLMMK